MVRLVGSNNQAMNDFGSGDLAQGISNYNGNNNDEWFHLYELGDIANPPTGITIHYVDQSGNKLAEDKDITQTTKTDGAPNYNDPYAFGDIYDLYQKIPGYAYQSTHLDSINGKQINAEVVYKVADSYTTNNDLVFPDPGTPVNNASYQWEYQEPNRNHGTNVTAYDLQRFGNTTDVYVVYAEGEETIPSHDSGGGADTGDLEEPKPVKTLTPNNDGTYDLSLSVKASSAEISKTNGANILLIWDMSWSMQNMRIADGRTRLEAGREAAKELATRLLALNNGRQTPLVEMLVLPFNADTLDDSDWLTQAGANNSTNRQRVNGFINGLDASGVGGGTNWERALENAKALADGHQDGDDTYIIFMTDGNPWMSNMANSHDTFSRDFFEKGAYFYATEPARAITKAGYELYGVGMYGNVDVLHLLLNFAYNARSTYDPTANAYGHFYLGQNQEDLIAALSDIAGEIEANLSMAGVEIKDGVALDTAHTALTVGGKVNGITYTKTAGKDEGSTAFTVRVGSNGVPMFSINGGAEQAGTTVSKTYTKLTKTDSGDVIASDATADVYRLTVGTSTYEMASASLNADGNLDWDLSPLGKLEDGATYTITTTVWPDQDAYDLVTDLNNGVATWNDSAATAVVEDGKVVFYQGGASKDGKQYPHIVKYPDGHYAAQSNTYQTLDYFVVDTEDGQTTYEARPTINMKFPDPMGLVDNTISIEKQWEKDMMPGADIPSSVTVSLLRDGEEFIPDIELKASEDWKTTKFIAPGMMISKEHADARLIEGQVVNYDGGVGNYVILNTGYDYKFAELWQQRFQLKDQTYHPMLVDNELWDVKIEGNNVTPIAKLTTGLVATNELKGGINIKKVVRDSANNIIDSNDVFDVAVTLSVPRDENDNPDFTNVDKFFVGDTVRTESVAWYAYYDENNVRQYDPALIEAGILEDSGQVDQQYGSKIGVGENHPLDEYYNYGSGWFMVDFDDTTGTVTGNVKVSDKYVLRFSNMAAGTTYSVAETVPAGYEASYAYEHVAYVDGQPQTPVPDGDTHVVVVNQGNNVTITNKQTSSDLIIIKADENGTPITSANDTAKFELVVNTASDGSGSWESAVDNGNDPHKIGTDGTFTINTTDGIELKGLKDGIYRLTELKAPEGYVILKEPMTFKLAGGVVKFVTITKSGSGDEEVWTVTELEKLDGYTITPKTTDSAAKLTVNNTPGASLPRTGGPGTTLFTITGSAMMALAVTYGISSRRRREGRSHI